MYFIYINNKSNYSYIICNIYIAYSNYLLNYSHCLQKLHTVAVKSDLKTYLKLHKFLKESPKIIPRLQEVTGI